MINNLNFQNGISPTTNRQTDQLRSNGGFLIQPFYDQNGNGYRDHDEAYFTENAEHLIKIDYESLSLYRPEIESDRLLVSLPIGRYRLDLEEAGYPLDWKPSSTSYAVEVKQGSYTAIEIPFTLVYTILGEISDSEGNPVKNVLLQAQSQNDDSKITSYANEAGVFYLDHLKPGTYNLTIDGQAIKPGRITIDKNTEPFQELIFTFDSTINESN